MRTALSVMAVVLVGVSAADAAQRRQEPRPDVREARDRGDDRWEDGRDGWYDARDTRRDLRRDIHGDVHVVFSTGDRRVVREYYAPRYRRLPPGLHKKYARTGYLPPGWQRRMQPMPWAVERRLGVLPHAYRRGVIDHHAVIYAPRTGVIIDATLVF